MSYQGLTVERQGNIFIITLQISDENRLTSIYCQEIIRAFHDIQRQVGPDAEGAVVTRGNNNKFFCTVGCSSRNRIQMARLTEFM
jgi:enoyl-CoA hydratase/carnithine racemase